MYGFLLFVLILLAIGVGLVCAWFLIGAIALIRGDAPFVLSAQERVDAMVALAEVKSTDTVIDLGCGDGRILLEALRRGAGKAVGYDLHQGGLWLARWRAWHQGVWPRLELHAASFWEVDLSRFDVVFVYQLPKNMPRILAQIKATCKPGTRIISHAFLFEGWEPEASKGAVYRYRV